MNKYNWLTCAFVVVAALAMASCGGGGGGTSSTPPPTTTAGTGTDTPTGGGTGGPTTSGTGSTGGTNTPAPTPSPSMAVNTEFEVSPVTIDKADSHVARTPDGGFVVVWAASSRFTGANSPEQGIFARSYAADGTALGPEFRVSDGPLTGWSFYNPHVTTLADGSIVAAWGATDGNGYFAQMRRFTANGQKGYGESRPSVRATNIVRLGDGGYVRFEIALAPTFGVTSQEAIGQRYSAANAMVGEPFTVLPAGIRLQRFFVAPTPDGGFAVSWAAYTSTESAPLEWYVRRYAADAAPLGAPTLAATLTGVSGQRPVAADFTVLAQGNFAFGALVDDFRNCTGGITASVMVASPTGAPLGPFVAIDGEADVAKKACPTPSGYPVFNPNHRALALAPLDDGNFLASWVTETRLPGAVMVRRFSPSAQALGGVVVATAPRAFSNDYLAAAGTGNNGAVVTWSHVGDRPDSPETSLRAHLWSPSTQLE
ncbi:hypothetical protein [Ramlibacter sp. PS4R-6]|uniref:hypothetical protein n=1 Tax=Ramlibacter sp. PS4R-6 TaxID=3133438 RepID=UPI0030ADDF73